MYQPGRDEDVPAPFDELQEEMIDVEAQILEEERGDASKKASKRSLVIVDDGKGKEKKGEAPKSQGPDASWVVKEVELLERGDFKDFEALADAKKHLEVHSEHFLWCSCCGSKFGTRKNVWQRHFRNQSHKDNAVKPKRNQQRLTGSVTDAAAEAAKRQRLAEEQVAHRLRVAKMVCSRPISINSVEEEGGLKELLEEARPRRMTLGSNLADDTKGPLIKDITARYMEEFRGRCVFITFDSTPRRDDVCAVAISYVTDDFKVVDRLGSLKLFGRQLDGTEWLDVILKTLERFKVDRRQVLFGNSDRGGPNKPCVRTLEKICPNFIQGWCIPHTLNRVGVKVSFPVLFEFQKAWNAVFKKSGAAQHVFWKIFKESWRRKSRVKWWTAFDQLEQVFLGFLHVGRVIESVQSLGYCKNTIGELQRCWNRQSEKLSDLSYSLAGYHDVLEPFVSTTHFLESALFISPFVYDKIVNLVRHAELVLSAKDCPRELSNVYALILSEPGHKKLVRWQFVQQAVRPALAYFYELLHNFKSDNTGDDDPSPITFRGIIDLFRFARIFHPAIGKKFLERYEKEDGSSFEEWKDLLVPKLVSTDDFSSLIDDLPKLVKLFESEGNAELDASDLLSWWKDHGAEVGTWSTLARKFALLRPSSALVERLFSIHLTALPSICLEQMRILKNYTHS